MTLVLILIIPVIILAAAFIWFVNISGIYTVVRETRKRRVTRERIKAAIEAK